MLPTFILLCHRAAPSITNPIRLQSGCFPTEALTKKGVVFFLHTPWTTELIWKRSKTLSVEKPLSSSEQTWEIRKNRGICSSQPLHLLNTSLFRVEDNRTNRGPWEGCSSMFLSLCFFTLDTWQETQKAFFFSEEVEYTVPKNTQVFLKNHLHPDFIISRIMMPKHKICCTWIIRCYVLHHLATSIKSFLGFISLTPGNHKLPYLSCKLQPFTVFEIPNPAHSTLFPSNCWRD